MSIPVLNQVYDEVRRLAIAGSAVAPGDFRLKKLIAPLEQAGQKAPVFAKLAQAASKVVDGNEKTASESLLELSTLVNAVLYTQGTTGMEGTLKPIDSVDMGLRVTQTSARVLKTLLEALTSTGSGRLEIIREAHERGSFKDLRLINASLAALDDSYPEIADYVSEKILPLYGNAILPELRARFDHKGRAGHVRRLALMHQLDPAGSREHVKHALDEGSKEVRIVAIGCLGDSPEDLDFLLEQSKARAKEVRQAAFRSLARSSHASAVAALQAVLSGGDIELAVEPIQASRHPEILKFVLSEATKQHKTLVTTKETDKKASEKNVSRMLLLLKCLHGRDDTGAEKFVIDCFDNRGKLASIKGDVSGKDIQQSLAELMANGTKAMQLALAGAHSTLNDHELSQSFVAATKAWPPKKVFDEFRQYMTRKIGEKAKKGSSTAKQEAISRILTGEWFQYYRSDGRDKGHRERFDPRWLDLAVEFNDLGMVQALARPGHKGAFDLLLKAAEERSRKSAGSHDIYQVLATMVDIGHPSASDSLIAVIEKYSFATHFYFVKWLGQIIPNVPKVDLPKFETLLTRLPDKAIDQLIDYVTELKNKAGTS